MFSKNKKKTDSKIRFQNRGFRRQLKNARGYKRPQRKIPQGDWQALFSKIGLGSWRSRLLTLAGFFVLVYAVFIPNVFFIKITVVNGANQEVYGDVYSLTSSYLTHSNPWPQKNLLLLSKNGLKNYLLNNDRKILSVNQINKILPSTLVVSVTARTDEFIIQTASSTSYSLSSDGLVTGQLPINASGTLPSGLILIKLTNVNDVQLDTNPLPKSSLNFISGVQGSLPQVAKSPIDYYEMPDLSSLDLNAYLKTGTVVKFSLVSDLNQTVGRLSLLFSQLTNSELQNLYYIDMRFTDRAYVCYKNTPCTQNTAIPGDNGSATSTAGSTISGNQ